MNFLDNLLARVDDAASRRTIEKLAEHPIVREAANAVEAESLAERRALVEQMAGLDQQHAKALAAAAKQYAAAEARVAAARADLASATEYFAEATRRLVGAGLDRERGESDFRAKLVAAAPPMLASARRAISDLDANMTAPQPATEYGAYGRVTIRVEYPTGYHDLMPVKFGAVRAIDEAMYQALDAEQVRDLVQQQIGIVNAAWRSVGMGLELGADGRVRSVHLN